MNRKVEKDFFGNIMKNGPLASGNDPTLPNALTAYLSPLAVWALAFGCAVGWGAFVMPGTTFLPMAGPLGTALGIAVGALVMGVIAYNYHVLAQHHPDAGGAYAYVKELCNHDHAFLCAWFLLLTYAAIVWANDTALVLIARNLVGGVFQFGFHYRLAGFEVWGGEIFASVSVLLAAGLLLSVSKRWAARLQAFLVLVLLGGAALAFAAVLRHSGGLAALAPGFVPGNDRLAAQVLGVAALAPWAFVGFESVSHSAEGFRFKRRRMFLLMAAALAASLFVYVALAAVAAAIRPEGFADWPAYVKALPRLSGVDALPVFHAVETAMGPTGVYILGATTLAAILTGVLGFLTAASRLLVAAARDGFFPRPLAALSRKSIPVRAVWALVAVSCLIPFVGRTAIGWIVDVTTIGASVAFPVYCLVPHLLSVGAFSTESYLILAVWGVLGALLFRHFLLRDTTGLLGKSTVVWLALLLLVFFSSHMWVRQATYRIADDVVTEVGAHYAAEASLEPPDPDDPYLVAEEDVIEDALTRYHLAQLGIVVLALAVMAGIYAAISRRERNAAKAKEYFFSTVSHDIRTPLNAIVGYAETLRLAPPSPAEREEAVASILASSRTLLGIVDDILDLSRLESGQLPIDPLPVDAPALFRETAGVFADDARKAGLDFRLSVSPMPRLLLDPVRLRQIVFNLVGNAVKFTEKASSTSAPPSPRPPAPSAAPSSSKSKTPASASPKKTSPASPPPTSSSAPNSPATAEPASASPSAATSPPPWTAPSTSAPPSAAAPPSPSPFPASKSPKKPPPPPTPPPPPPNPPSPPTHPRNPGNPSHPNPPPPPPTASSSSTTPR